MGKRGTIMWYRIYPTTGDFAIPAKNWGSLAKSKYLCSLCGNIRRDAGPVNVPIQTIQNPRPAINFVWGVGDVYYARTDFVETLGIDLFDAVFYLGKLLDRDGREHKEYTTYVPRQYPVPVRASKAEVGSSHCPECGEICYFGIEGREYVLNRDLDQERPLQACGCAGGGFLINESVLARIDRKRWKGLGVVKLAVRDEPIDGLPVDLTQLPFITFEERKMMLAKKISEAKRTLK